MIWRVSGDATHHNLAALGSLKGSSMEGMANMKRILLAVLFCFAFYEPAFAAEKKETFEGLGVSYDDHLWDMLSGTSTNNKQPLSLEKLYKVLRKFPLTLEWNCTGILVCQWSFN